MTDYGTDLSCVTDLRPNLGTVSGRMLLAEAIARRITTPRGMLLDDPNYGIDIREWINDGMTLADLRRRPQIIDREIEKDERVVSSSTSMSFVNSVLTLTITVTDGDGPFPLVLAVSSLTVEILKAS